MDESILPSPARRADDALRVLLVDDHDVFRGGLRRLLEEHGVGDITEAAHAEAAIAQVAELAPDVVIMDLNLPGLSGIEAIREVTRLAPSTHTLVLTVSDDADDVYEAIAAGADGYLLKSAPPEQIVLGLRAAAAGESLISPRIAARLIAHVRAAGEHGRATAIQTTLSPREIEVLRLVSQGRENSEIAETLVISPRTVKNHIANILEKLHMDNRIQAAVFAARSGMLDDTPA